MVIYYLTVYISQTIFPPGNTFKAIEFGLNMDYDVAMAKLTFSGIAMQKRSKREATMLLNEAKKLDKQNMLAEQIKMMQQQMKKI